MNKIPIAVIGTGNIGADLCERILVNEDLHLVSVIGRRSNSPGLKRLQGRVPGARDDGAVGLRDVIAEVDGVLDATSATDHIEHWNIARDAGKWMIDLTPSRIGTPWVPILRDVMPEMAVQPQSCRNLSMVSCGGQSAAPIVRALSESSKGVQYVEVSSSIAARSAGPATRRNIDNYVESTEGLIQLISRTPNVKSILVLNPSEPPVMMRTTVHIEAEWTDVEKAQILLDRLVESLQAYVPGYAISVPAHSPRKGVVSATARVEGAGFFLPSFAGNLDIINAAAVEAARLLGRPLPTEG